MNRLISQFPLFLAGLGIGCTILLLILIVLRCMESTGKEIEEDYRENGD